MKRWERLGRVFKAENQRPWIQSHSQVPCPILLEDRIRVFFATRKRQANTNYYESNTGFFDLSRKDPTRLLDISENPVIDLGPTGTFSQHGISPSHAIYDENKIKLYFGGWNRQIEIPYQIAIGLAHSIDQGKNFVKIGEGPIIDRAPKEPFGVNSVWVGFIKNTWQMLYSGVLSWSNLISKKPSAQYVIFSATSSDGEVWFRSGEAILPPIPAQDCQCVPSVVTYGDMHHLWYSHRKGSSYRNATGGYTISHAMSSDFRHWSPSNLLSFAQSKNGFDSKMVCYPAALEVDDELYLFYCGNDFGKAGIGIARLIGGSKQLFNI